MVVHVHLSRKQLPSRILISGKHGAYGAELHPAHLQVAAQRILHGGRLRTVDHIPRRIIASLNRLGSLQQPGAVAHAVLGGIHLYGGGEHGQSKGVILLHPRLLLLFRLRPKGHSPGLRPVSLKAVLHVEHQQIGPLQRLHIGFVVNIRLLIPGQPGEEGGHRVGIVYRRAEGLQSVQLHRLPRLHISHRHQPAVEDHRHIFQVKGKLVGHRAAHLPVVIADISRQAAAGAVLFLPGKAEVSRIKSRRIMDGH